MAGVVETTDTFTTNQVITSTLMNNIIDQTLFTSDALANSTLALTSGKMKVATSGITSNEMGVAAITANAIAADAVTTAKILDANVTTAKILDANVTTAKILDANVTTAKIADANVTPAKLSQPLTRATAQNSTSGTNVNFTSIPSWVKKISVLFSSVSTSGTSNLLIQIGSGSIVTTGYESGLSLVGATSVLSTSATNGFLITAYDSAAYLKSGIITIANLSGNTWVSSGVLGITVGGSFISGGNLTLGGVLDQIRVTTVNGTDTFDAGVINIIYE
jgi:uncharacterized protein YjbI with pentapeptide repeats